MWFWHGEKFFPEPVSTDAISAKVTGYVLKPCRFWNSGFNIRASPMSGVRFWVRPFWVKTVQTVNPRYLITVFSEYGGQN